MILDTRIRMNYEYIGCTGGGKATATPRRLLHMNRHEKSGREINRSVHSTAAGSDPQRAAKF
jgi:hypothetical protein